MNKNFRTYALIWAIMLVAWNVIVFLVRPVLPGYEINYDARFWVAWVFILIAFIGNLFCANIVFKEKNAQKVFYKLPLITITSSALITILVIGSVLMLIPNCPAWIAAIICILVVAYNTIAVIKAAWASEAVERIDEKVKTQTAYIKNLTVEADNVLARAKSNEAKAACKKVYEAIRYSDPMSNDALSVIEAKITVKMDEFSTAVEADDAEKVKGIAEELLLLVGDRNRKCKALK